MDLTSVKDVITTLLGGLSIASLLYTWISARSKASQGEIVKIHDRVDALDIRTLKIESDIRHLPDSTGFHRMELSMARLQGDMEVLTERLKPIAAVGDRLQEFLLDQVSKK